MQKVNYIYGRFEHHAQHSGYDQIVKYISGQKVESRAILYILNKLPQGLVRILKQRAYKWWYHNENLATELKIALLMIMKGKRLYHFLYGDKDYSLLRFFNGLRGNKILSTYHQPPCILDQCLISKGHLKHLNGIIAVANNQISYFKRYVEKERIFFVPHGVDINFFHPLDGSKEQGFKRCLSVGHWLRDFDVLREVIRIVNKKEKEIKFIIVTREEYFDIFRNLTNVELLCGISENELLTLYQTSDALLLPLKDATANNVLLEGASCGLPVVVTDVGGIRDYVDEACAVLIPQGKNQAELMAEGLCKVLRDNNRRLGMSKMCRQRALEFNWEIVAGKMEEVYKQVLS